jgi:hypothetical protein
LSLTNRHISSVSVYLFNAAKPTTPSIQITRQTRNETQSVGEIELTFHPPANSVSAVWIVALAATLLGAGTLMSSRKRIRRFHQR